MRLPSWLLLLYGRGSSHESSIFCGCRTRHRDCSCLNAGEKKSFYGQKLQPGAERARELTASVNALEQGQCGGIAWTCSPGCPAPRCAPQQLFSFMSRVLLSSSPAGCRENLEKSEKTLENHEKTLNQPRHSADVSSGLPELEPA